MILQIIDCFTKESKTLSLMPERLALNSSYDENIFFENKKYEIIVNVQNLDQIKAVNIYVGDIQIPAYYDESAKIVKCSSDYIFIDCFDLVKIQTEIIFIDDTIDIFTTNQIRIAVPKTTNQYIEKMLYDIENNYSDIIEACFSKNKKQSGISEKGAKGIESTFVLLDDIYNIFKEVYPFFQNEASKKIDNKEKIIRGFNTNNITSENINWLFLHPENMQESKIESPIIFHGKYYHVENIRSSYRYESYNTYENQMVLGFIDHLIKYLDDLSAGVDIQLEEYKKEIPVNIRNQLPEEYDLAFNCIAFYYKEIQKRVSYYMNIYNNLYEAYHSCLRCETKALNAIPRYTFIFRQRFHYHQCFEAIVKWFEAGQYHLLTCNYFFKLKKLSKIFEYYTLLKIREGIEAYGTSLQTADCIIYDEEKNISDINNYYRYVQNDNYSVKIEVYYEPYIYRDKITNGLELYSTGYKFLEEMQENKFWTPDFVLKISMENKKAYFILDSKFSSFKTVKKHRMAEIINKYILSIATKDCYYSKVLGLWGIYPSLKNRHMNLKRNNVASSKESLPIIEIQALESDNNCMNDLIDRMIKISSDYFSIQE